MRHLSVGLFYFSDLIAFEMQEIYIDPESAPDNTNILEKKR